MICKAIAASGHTFVFRFAPHEVEWALDSVANYWCQGLLSEEDGLAISAELEELASRELEHACMGR